MGNDIRDIFKKINELSVDNDDTMNVGDSFDIELSENFNIETGIVGFTNDGVIVEADESMLEFLDLNGVLLESEELYERIETKIVNGEELTYVKTRSGRIKGVIWQTVDDDWALEVSKTGMSYDGIDSKEEAIEFLETEIDESLDEAEYQGRKVSLGKPFLTPDGPKKRSVYVKKPDGKVVKVNFGDKKMKIKKSNPARRKSFRARHRCDNPGPRWKARYWACKTW